MRPVLVIEDERDILDLLKYHLEQSGFRVLTATDGGRLFLNQSHLRLGWFALQGQDSKIKSIFLDRLFPFL